MPEVSICLTTYNRGSVLHKTIDSILNQTFTDFELIISDDNSSDNTKEICIAYQVVDERIKYYRNDLNLKMPGNLNNAISKATGKFIANLHDGDVYSPYLIQKWYDLITKDDEIIFVFNQYRFLDEKNVFKYIIDHGFNEINDGEIVRDYLYRTFSSAPWGTVMVKREAYEAGLFNPKYGFISDVEMWMRLSLQGKVGYVQDPIIDLTPREKTHKYFLPHTITYTNALIIYEYFKKEHKTKVTSKQIINNIKSHLFRSVLVLIKYKNIQRVKEYLFLIKHSSFTNLKILLSPLFVFFKPTEPEVFDITIWKKICKLN